MPHQDKQVSRSSKKYVYWLLFGGTATLLISIGAALIARSFITQIPNLLKEALGKEGIVLNYKETHSLLGGFGIEISEISISGNNLPIKARTESLSIKLGISPNLKPLAVEILLFNSTLTKQQNETSLPTTVEEVRLSKFPVVGKWASLVTKLFRPKLVIENLSAPEFGFKHLHYTLNSLSLSVDLNKNPSITGDHSLQIEEITDHPIFNGSELIGRFKFQPPKLFLTNHKVITGPFSVSFDGDYNTLNTSWNLQTDIPATSLKQSPIMISPKMLRNLVIQSGTFSLKSSLSGRGADPKNITGTGLLELENFSSKVKHTFSDGSFKGDLKILFKKASSLEVSVDSNFNLDDLMFRYENLFYKERGVPLSLELHFKGNENRIALTPSKFSFHSLNSTFEGDLAVKSSETSKIKFKIDPTDLERWERFFPANTDIRTSGSLTAEGNFTGSFDDWKTGQLNLDLHAQEVRLPILPQWTTNKDIFLNGILTLNSRTKIQLANGMIRALGTDSNLNLSSAQLKYGSFFKKLPGTRMNLDLIIKSDSVKAEIKRGLFELGNMKVSAVGNINRFNNPIANLSIESTPITLAQLLEFCPTLTPKNISEVGGTMTLKSKIEGPLLEKAIPSVTGHLDLRNFSLNYSLESPKKKISLLNLSGLLTFSNNSMSSSKLSFTFPHTRGLATFSVRNFSSPTTEFNIKAEEFSVRDFHDVPKNSKIAVGALPVPTSSNKESGTDFRSNPLLKKLSVEGAVSIKKADLGPTSAENITAHLSFHDMHLKVQPLKMDLFGGKIVSETDWNGSVDIPITRQKLKVENVDANQFLSTYSEQASNLLEGRFFTNMNLLFSGLNAEAIKKSIEGNGEFTLKDGQIKTIRFTKGPLEKLKNIPRIGQGIIKTDWDEKLNNASGNFKVKNGQLGLSNLVLHSPYFDATASKSTIDTNQNISASVLWSPKSNLITGESAEILRDEQGKTSVPLTLSGNIMSPTISIDSGVFEARAKKYLERRVAEEKDRLLQDTKKRALTESKKKIQNTLKNNLPKELENLF